MQKVLEQIQSGEFAREWIAENDEGLHWSASDWKGILKGKEDTSGLSDSTQYFCNRFGE